MKFYLIRHGQTPYNKEYRYQGKRTDLPLSAEGRAALRPVRDLSPQRVYVTSLSRTGETASILFPGAEQVIVPGLEEMDFGTFEGRNYREMEHDPAYRAWVDSRCTGRCPDGEDLETFSNRVCQALITLVDQALQDHLTELIVVAHGGTQMAAMARLATPKQEYFSHPAQNGEGYLLEIDPERWAADHTMTLLQRVSFLREKENEGDNS